jgi:hypothetical protein
MNSVLRLFNSVINNPTGSDYSCHPEYGIIIAPSAQYKKQEILSYFKKTFADHNDLNSKAFYKNWDKVFNVDILERYRDQITHYFTTYGFESMGLYSEDFIYLPVGETETPETYKFRVIKGVSKQDIVDSCLNMLKSGVALKLETIIDILDALKECEYKFNGSEQIKNREAAVIVADMIGVLPKSGEDLFRYIYYKFTKNTMVIKNRQSIQAIKSGFYVIPKLNNQQLVELSKSFNRFKPLWLAIKSHKKNSSIVNKISKLSKSNHQPMPVSVMSNLTGFFFSEKQIKEACKKANIYQLVRAANSLLYYSKCSEDKFYRIRNGKGWYKKKLSVPKNENSFSLIAEEIKARISSKNIYVPKGIDYALPVSEKMYLGNIPVGSSVRVNKQDGKKFLVGVYWKNADSIVDLDLSGMFKSYKVGWNGSWNYNGSIGYSGDVTSAPQGASEWLYFDSIDDDCIVTLNQYRSPADHPYNVILGYSSNNKISRNYLIDPNEIVFQTTAKCYQKQQILGIIKPSEDGFVYYIVDQGACDSIVSGYSTKDTIIKNSIIDQFTSRIMLSDVFSIVSKDDCDVDLTPDNLSKDSIIKLFN